MLDAYVYDGIRTPFGRRGGALAPVRPDDLLAHVLRTVAERTGLDAARLDDVVVGCANQAGEDSRCVARHASLLAGFPAEVPGTVIQRNCGSGLGALIAAGHAITSGEACLVLSGGVESMTRAPFVVAKGEQAYDPRFTVYDSAVGARFPNPRITEEYGDDTMPQTADNLAVEYGIDRESADAYALRSQQRWASASADDFFDGEVTPVAIPGDRRRPDTTVTEDEPPRSDTEADKLAKLRPLNPGGVTTAGNASGINDGAVALLLGSRDAAGTLGREPVARLLASAVAGVPPRVMGIGPVAASRKALKRAGRDLGDMDVIEINEAFAAQVLACTSALGLDSADDRVNPNGGAIAVGHPLGASGPRLALTAIRELERRRGRYALVSLCIGMGQGIALVFERA